MRFFFLYYVIQSFLLVVEACDVEGESMMKLLVQMNAFLVLGEAFRHEDVMGGGCMMDVNCGEVSSFFHGEVGMNGGRLENSFLRTGLMLGALQASNWSDAVMLIRGAYLVE